MTTTSLKSTLDAPTARQRRRSQTPGQRAGRITRRTLTNLLIVVILVVAYVLLFLFGFPFVFFVLLGLGESIFHFRARRFSHAPPPPS